MQPDFHPLIIGNNFMAAASRDLCHRRAGAKGDQGLRAHDARMGAVVEPESRTGYSP